MMQSRYCWNELSHSGSINYIHKYLFEGNPRYPHSLSRGAHNVLCQFSGYYWVGQISIHFTRTRMGHEALNGSTSTSSCGMFYGSKCETVGGIRK